MNSNASATLKPVPRRAFIVLSPASLDYAHKAEDEAVRKEHQAFVELMIPIVSPWFAGFGGTSG